MHRKTNIYVIKMQWFNKSSSMPAAQTQQKQILRRSNFINKIIPNSNVNNLINKIITNNNNAQLYYLLNVKRANCRYSNRSTHAFCITKANINTKKILIKETELQYKIEGFRFCKQEHMLLHVNKNNTKSCIETKVTILKKQS